MTCPGDLELARAHAAGAPEISAHLEACASCRAAWAGTRALIELARELPVALPPPARREEVRTAVLAAAAGLAHRPARRAWRVPGVAGAAAAAAVAGYLAIARSPAPEIAHHAHGTVRPHPGARYLVRSVAPDEVVALGDGAIDVEVEPLHPGERFRVVVGDAVLEVRGTAFTATARAEHLIAVAVAHGQVDLVPALGAALGAPATLTAGQSWHAAVGAAPAAPAPPIATASPVPPAPPIATASPVPPAPPVARDSRELAERSPAATPPPSPPSPPVAGDSRELAERSPAATPPPSPPSPPVARDSRELAERSPSAPPPPSPPRASSPRSPGAAPPRPHRVTAAARREPDPPSATAPSPPTTAQPSTAPPPVASSARAPEEVSYDDAWAALRRGDFTRAAGGFARVVLLAPDRPLGEDASFWRAVALARGKRSLEAVAAFHDFLDGYARSSRAGEASAMLGWLLIDARAFDEAERRFQAAAGDPDPAVRRSARAGLDALARRTR
jgi:TolA-binding protein